MLQKIQTLLYKSFWEHIFDYFTITIAITNIPIAVSIFQFQHELALRLFELPPLFVLWTLTILTLLVFTLLITILLTRSRFYWDKEVGTWNNRRNHLRNCGVCYPKGLVSPLKNETKGWSCVVCKQFYIDSTKNQTQTIRRELVAFAPMKF